MKYNVRDPKTGRFVKRCAVAAKPIEPEIPAWKIEFDKQMAKFHEAMAKFNASMESFKNA